MLKPVWQRTNECPDCGWICDRDYNAAWNILKQGLKELGKEQPEDTPADTEPLQKPDLKLVPASSVVETGSPILTKAERPKVRAE